MAFMIGGETLKQALINFLGEQITDHKRSLFAQVLPYRTRHLTVVLDGVDQQQDANAVLRSCECFGIQNVHLIQSSGSFKVRPGVSLGAAKWLTLHRYIGSGHRPVSHADQRDDASSQLTAACFEELRRTGYRILGVTRDQRARPVAELDLDQKLALCFGPEEGGLSTHARSAADDWVCWPNLGHGVGFNLSVSVALMLFELTGRLHRSHQAWQLTSAERDDLLLEWYAKIPKRIKLLTARFLQLHDLPLAALEKAQLPVGFLDLIK